MNMHVKSLRNICIIAHVDHGKTTLVDHMLRQAGTFAAHEELKERVMDSMDLERERGITIMAKNASIQLGDVKVNLVDTPGHADFGGEVERIMSMVDGALLLVDAAEGPLPQTRFVLKKAIAQGLRLILVVNKVDRSECADGARIHQVVNETFDLFVDLGASDTQLDFPILYTCARLGWTTTEFEEIAPLVAGRKGGTLEPLFEAILRYIPAPQVTEEGIFKMLVANIAYSSYVGSLAIGRVFSGAVVRNGKLVCMGKDQAKEFLVTRIYQFRGLERIEVDQLNAGDIGAIAGYETFAIGDTLSSSKEAQALPRISVEEPTLAMIFSINTSPLAGKEGKAVQPKQLRERLVQEVRNNVALGFEDTEVADQFRVFGRGELQFAILIEQMRREGMEFMVGTPSVLYRFDENQTRLEPIEMAVLDLPEAYAGEVTQLFQEKRGILTRYETDALSREKRVRLEFKIPTRGLLGMRTRFLTATRGEGIMSSILSGYEPHRGAIARRAGGALIADRGGETVEYALLNLEDRGILFYGPGVPVYEGMLIGEHSRANDLNVNVCREKKLTNVRAAHAEVLVTLRGTREMTLEKCLEWIDEDEWIEITPERIRMRKKVLAQNLRSLRRSERID